MIRFALYDEQLQPLAIVSLDWDPQRQGPVIRIPVFPDLSAETYRPFAVAPMAQQIDLNVMTIRLLDLHRKDKDGNRVDGWLGTTETPELCERFFKIKF